MSDISKLDNKQFAVVWQGLIRKIKEDPIENFVKAPGFIDFTPTAAQEVILKVIFKKRLDNSEPKLVQMEVKDGFGNFDLEDRYMTEVEIYEFLTEKRYVGPQEDPAMVALLGDETINKIDLICGRRSGKTTLAAIIAIYYAIHENWKPFLKKTPFATVLILSHSREFSDEVLEMIRTFIESSKVLSRLINKQKKNSTSTMNLKTPWIVDSRTNNNGKALQWSRVQIKVGAASSKTTRGVAAVVVICDEIAYWNLEENLKETDAKILKAVRPALKQFGKYSMLIKLSSPGIRQGVLHDEYKKDRAGELPASYAVFKAPSWVMNTILPKSEFIEEWKLDPDGFDTEYRANFTDSLSNFILPEFTDMAVLRGVKFHPPEPEENVGRDGIRYRAAIDAAYKSDRFTFSVAAVVNGRLKQFVSKGWKGTKKDPVSAYEVAEYIKNVCKTFGIDHVAADQYSFQPLKEIFDRYGVTLEEHPFTPKFKRQIYFNLKKLIHSQQADLLDNEIQTRELKELVVEQSSMGMIKIGHPQGGSDDYSDSLAIAAFLATQEQSIGKFEFQGVGLTKDYGIDTDKNGVAFTAPSAEMLSLSGHMDSGIMDNSESYIKDPKTGKLRRVEDLEEDEGGPQFCF